MKTTFMIRGSGVFSFKDELVCIIQIIIMCTTLCRLYHFHEALALHPQWPAPNNRNTPKSIFTFAVIITNLTKKWSKKEKKMQGESWLTGSKRESWSCCDGCCWWKMIVTPIAPHSPSLLFPHTVAAKKFRYYLHVKSNSNGPSE